MIDKYLCKWQEIINTIIEPSGSFRSHQLASVDNSCIRYFEKVLDLLYSDSSSANFKTWQNTLYLFVSPTYWFFFPPSDISMVHQQAYSVFWLSLTFASLRQRKNDQVWWRRVIKDGEGRKSGGFVMLTSRPWSSEDKYWCCGSVGGGGQGIKEWREKRWVTS